MDQITTSWDNRHRVPGYLFNITRLINGDYAKVHGYEGYSTSGRTVLGFRMYTRTGLKSFVNGEERPLEGTAPSVYSIALMYERGPWSLGATADRTDGFVTAINVLGAGFNETADSITWLTYAQTFTASTTRSASRLQGIRSMTSRPTASTVIRCCRGVITATAGR